MKAKRKTISMEEYMDYVYSGKQTDLTVDILKQIINMHGFNKTSRPKGVLRDALSTLELMNPSRSTLKENISSCAPITKRNLVQDLENLDWKECCITSIKTLSSCQLDQGKEKHENSVRPSNLKKSNDTSKCGASSAANIDRVIRGTSPSLLPSFGAKTGLKASQSTKKRKSDCDGCR